VHGVLGNSAQTMSTGEEGEDKTSDDCLEDKRENFKNCSVPCCA